jgi:hypothetical protein
LQHIRNDRLDATPSQMAPRQLIGGVPVGSARLRVYAIFAR